jgi:hypothetical protein
VLQGTYDRISSDKLMVRSGREVAGYTKMHIRCNVIISRKLQ